MENLDLNQLQQAYWVKVTELQAIASSYKISLKSLTDNIENYDWPTRMKVEKLLWEQVNLIERILTLKKTSLKSNQIINLSSYRQLARS